MNSFIRLLINLTATAVIILLFRHIGWIEFVKPPELITDPVLNDILIAGIIGFIIFIIGEIAGIAYGTFVILTCGLACLVYPIFCLILGYMKLYGTQLILIDWFDFDHIWWKATIISFAIGLFRIPNVKERKRIVVKEKRN